MLRKVKRKRRLTYVMLGLFLAVGLSLMLYPMVSDMYNRYRQQKAADEYEEITSALEQEVIESLLQEAEEYNAALLENSSRFIMSEEELAEYEQLLRVEGTEAIGYVEIAKIDVYMPIFLGTSSEVLYTGAGHLEGSSLPIGGESTHSVISGHSGLPSAKIFSELDQLEEGDTFVLTVLGQKLTYEVDNIEIVEPSEIDALEIVEGEDYCTLMTCFPYGINTHRLLVRGHRIENESVNAEVVEEAYHEQVVIVVAGTAALLLIIWFLKRKNARSRKVKEKLRRYIITSRDKINFTSRRRSNEEDNKGG